MNERFEFVTTNCSGHSVRGTISASVGSLVNTGVLEVDLPHLGPGTLDRKDDIDIFAIVDDLRLPVFTGIVSALRSRGELLRIEFATRTAYMQVARTSVRTWANVKADQVVRDIVSDSTFPVELIRMPDSLKQIFLHAWGTDGGTVADEVQALLDQVLPSAVFSGGLDGFAFIGDRYELAESLPPTLYPTNEMTSAADVDSMSFSLRHAFPGAPCFDADGEFVGTLDRVAYIIEPRTSRTELILDSTYDARIAALGAA